MKTILLTCLFLLVGKAAYAQQAGYWTAFWDKKEEKFGFKDQQGQVKIQPTFGSMSQVNRLEHVFIASEVKDRFVDSYYLTKSGKLFGRDSVYFFDGTPDCESEGFIRFRDPGTEKVGMFNRKGEVVIPAWYNHLSQVKNGLVIGLKDAQKQYSEEHQHSGCNHFSWTGGQTLLLDTTNTPILEKFTYSLNLDLYSHLRQDHSEENPNREYFLGVDGKRHSFVNVDKDFSSWLHQSLPENFTLENLKQIAYPHLTFWKNGKGWVSKPSERILEKNFALLKDRLSKIKKPGQDFFISVGDLNQGIFDGKAYALYFNNCGQGLTGKYPLLQVVISHEKGDDLYQDHFDFLKTENGYKLISLSISNAPIKE